MLLIAAGSWPAPALGKRAGFSLFRWHAQRRSNAFLTTWGLSLLSLPRVELTPLGGATGRAERGFRSLILHSAGEETGLGGIPARSLCPREAGWCADLPCPSQAPGEYASRIYGQLKQIRFFRLTAKKGGALLATAGLFF